MQRNGKRARERVLISFTVVVVRMGGDFFFCARCAATPDSGVVGRKGLRILYQSGFALLKHYNNKFHITHSCCEHVIVRCNQTNQV